MGKVSGERREEREESARTYARSNAGNRSESRSEHVCERCGGSCEEWRGKKRKSKQDARSVFERTVRRSSWVLRVHKQRRLLTRDKG